MKDQQIDKALKKFNYHQKWEKIKNKESKSFRSSIISVMSSDRED